jgi:hypothetical protein
MIARKKMGCFVASVKHVSDIRAIVREPSLTMITVLEAVSSVGSAPRLFSEDSRPDE